LEWSSSRSFSHSAIWIILFFFLSSSKLAHLTSIIEPPLSLINSYNLTFYSCQLKNACNSNQEMVTKITRKDAIILTMKIPRTLNICYSHTFVSHTHSILTHICYSHTFVLTQFCYLHIFITHTHPFLT